MQDVSEVFDGLFWNPLIHRDTRLRVTVFNQTWVIDTRTFLDPLEAFVQPITMYPPDRSGIVEFDLQGCRER